MKVIIGLLLSLVSLVNSLGGQYKEIAWIKGSHTHEIFRVSFSPADYYILSVAGDGTAKIWLTENRMMLKAFPLRGGWVPNLPFQFSPDAKFFCYQDSDRIYFWDMIFQRNAATLIGHTGPVRAVAFSSDGKRLASGGLGVRPSNSYV